MDPNKTLVSVECENRSHDGLGLVMEGARLSNELLGQDAAFIAFLFTEYDALIEFLERQVDHFSFKNAMLKEAIKKHRAAQGHEMCHENDDELYTVLNDGVKVDHKPPSRCEFRQKCKEYYESRPNAEKVQDGW